MKGSQEEVAVCCATRFLLRLSLEPQAIPQNCFRAALEILLPGNVIGLARIKSYKLFKKRENCLSALASCDLGLAGKKSSQIQTLRIATDQSSGVTCPKSHSPSAALEPCVSAAKTQSPSLEGWGGLTPCVQSIRAWHSRG